MAMNTEVTYGKKIIFTLFLIPFLSILAEEKKNMTIETLKSSSQSRFYLGYAYMLSSAYFFGRYGHDNFTQIPKLERQISRIEELSLLSMVPNPVDTNPRQTESNFIFLNFKTSELIHTKNETINNLRSNNDWHLSMGFLTLIVGIANFLYSNELSEEIKKKEKSVFTPQIKIGMKRDVLELNMLISF